MATPALRIADLTHRYGTRDALKGVSFDVQAGELFALLGPNGGGKTTLVRIVTTVLEPTGGDVRVFGRGVGRQPAHVRRDLGVMFQSPALDARLRVSENLRYHGHLYGLRGRALARRVKEVLAIVRLENRAREMVGTLSGGLQRRVELAKALLPSPRLLVLDEPGNGLDPGARRDLWDHLAHLRDVSGTTILVTTHLMDEAARCDRVAIVHEGRLVALGAPEALTGSIGGEVIFIAAADLHGLARRIQERFGHQPEVIDGRVRLERPRAHEFVTDLVAAFPGDIDAISFGKPTLEDVFMHHTGRKLD